MRLAMLLMFCTLAAAHGFPRNFPSDSSLKELGAAKNQPNVSQPLALTCAGEGECDESKLHSLAARVPRRGAKGTTTSAPSRTSTTKSLSPPRSSTPRSTEGQSSPSSGARGHHTTEIRTSFVTTRSALGDSAPSVTSSKTATTSSHSKVHRVSPKTIVAIVVAVIVVLLIVVVVIGLVLWWRKRAGKGQRGGDYRGLFPSQGHLGSVLGS